MVVKSYRGNCLKDIVYLGDSTGRLKEKRGNGCHVFAVVKGSPDC